MRPVEGLVVLRGRERPVFVHGAGSVGVRAWTSDSILEGRGKDTAEALTRLRELRAKA